MIYTYNREKTFMNSFYYACVSSVNAITSLTFASLALGHFNTQVCLTIKNPTSWRSPNSFCMPTQETVSYSNYFSRFSKENLSHFSDSFLDFSAGVAGILSLYFANEAYKNFKRVF